MSGRILCVTRLGPFHACLALAMAGPRAAWAAFNFGKTSDAYGIHEMLGTDPDQKPFPVELALIESNAPGNLFRQRE